MLICHSWETRKGPRGQTSSRARPIACAPIRILLQCSRRSQSSLLPLARQPLATRQGDPPIPLTLRHLTNARCPPPERLALPTPTDPCVPIRYSQDAPARPASSLEKPGRAEKTRKDYRSASRPSLQAPEPVGLGIPDFAYLISTVAMPSNFFLIVSASSLVAFSLIALGAPSTRSLASFKPKEVTSRTALMVLILFAP